MTLKFRAVSCLSWLNIFVVAVTTSLSREAECLKGEHGHALAKVATVWSLRLSISNRERLRMRLDRGQYMCTLYLENFIFRRSHCWASQQWHTIICAYIPKSCQIKMRNKKQRQE